MLQIAILFGILTHIVGCLWYMIGEHEYIKRSKGWLAEDELARSMGSSRKVKLLRSLYYSYMTNTSVGYGDVVPKTDLETVLAMLAVLVGATIYAGFIAIITVNFAEKDSKLHLQKSHNYGW